MSTAARVTRVQRVAETWPIVHLEAAAPAWDQLAVDGHVAHPRRFDLPALAAISTESRNADFHCVWGWSRINERWAGIGVDQLLDFVGAHGSHVTVHAASHQYSTCLPIEDAARGFLAWEHDGQPLAANEGGPLRFLPPSDMWAYKGVKWAQRISVGDRFVPGFWESRVADPIGRIPPEVVLP